MVFNRLLGKLLKGESSIKKDFRLTTATTVTVQPIESLLRKYLWSVTHNFFASTGGFALEVDDNSLTAGKHASSGFLPSRCPQRLTLTARGMALLARCGHLPDIPEGDILDKSKANGLAKAMVMVQAMDDASGP